MRTAWELPDVAVLRVHTHSNSPRWFKSGASYSRTLPCESWEELLKLQRVVSSITFSSPIIFPFISFYLYFPVNFHFHYCILITPYQSSYLFPNRYNGHLGCSVPRTLPDLLITKAQRIWWSGAPWCTYLFVRVIFTGFLYPDFLRVSYIFLLNTFIQPTLPQLYHLQAVLYLSCSTYTYTVSQL